MIDDDDLVVSALQSRCITAKGGLFLEAPVSGSKVKAGTHPIYNLLIYLPIYLSTYLSAGCDDGCDAL